MEIREIGEDELPALVQVLRAAQPRSDNTVSGFVSWRDQADAMVWLLCEREAETIGAGFALTGWHTPPHRAIGATLVVPGARGVGAGTTILEAIGAWARAHGATELDGQIAEEDSASIEWARRRGFVEAGRDSRLVLDLSEIETPRPDPPPGIEIVPWATRPELAQGLYEVAREAGPDIPGNEEDDIGTIEEWLARDMGSIGDDPRAVFVALAGDEVVGFAKFSLLPEDDERAFHDLTGVRRAWRGRGIAAGLKRTQIAWAKANGFSSLHTSNEVRNEPIRRLNERHGYVVEPGSVTVRGTIAAT
jgi:GNAT superfamily N-acetyltransferase